MDGIVRVGGGEFPGYVQGLARVLADAVEDGASVGFLTPFGQEAAQEWWRGQAAAVAAGSLLVWAVRDGAGIEATVSVTLEAKPNSRHRAYVGKLIVHRNARGRGLGRALLATAERGAAAAGATLLMLDTETGSPAENLYLADGWTRYGIVPDYAASPDGTLRDCSFFHKWLTNA